MQKNIYRLGQNFPGPFLQLCIIYVSNRMFDYDGGKFLVSLRLGQCPYGVPKNGGNNKRGRDALFLQLNTVEQTARAARPSVAQRGDRKMGFPDIFTQLFKSAGP